MSVAELGEWRAPGLAAEKASQYGLHLHSTSFLNEVKIGGFQEGHQIGVLHQILNTEEQVCVENQRECTSSENAHTEAQVPLRNEEHVPTEGVSIWTHEKVLLLIELYREHRALFSNSAIKRHEVWRKIASQIHEKGHHVTDDYTQKALGPLSLAAPSTSTSTSTAQSPSTPASPSASTAQSTSAKSPNPDFLDRRSKKRKRTVAGPPQWFLDYAQQQKEEMGKLRQEFQEKNLIMKEKKNLLKHKIDLLDKHLADQTKLFQEKNDLLKSYINKLHAPPRPGSSD
ncbi:hypothetical protein C0Q70_10969 [Pomacea canaliculata]|uniref:Myb/SANT-like DNA-binding domain-containing protein n=1 Tax=Pomacea canaliculata TaxID=400727 RepID=A0A2T7P4N0_POMCA|nr:hypothetical protein C0Q70_10969 [Pomacea canaliculata]